MTAWQPPIDLPTDPLDLPLFLLHDVGIQPAS